MLWNHFKDFIVEPYLLWDGVCVCVVCVCVGGGAPMLPLRRKTLKSHTRGPLLLSFISMIEDDNNLER